ncbi:MAG: TIR domain-containing protein, partial [Anaerolineae bacterium]|nr:TIR domain-containing protein [Anaerolineae bacterium]
MPQYHAFLSYARDDDQRPDGSRADWSKSDESFMCRLYEALTAAGLNIWWDREKLESRGLSFSDEIRDAINDSRRLVLVVGPHAVLGGMDKAGQPITPKEWVQKEIEHAQTYCIGISPILRLGDYDSFQKVPYEFRKIARGDIPDFRNDADFDRAVKQLIRQLQGEVAPMGTLHGVPLLPTYYIKRNDALDELERKIRLDSDNVTVISAQGRQPTTDEQAVAVQGMGGIGKSTLAAAMAHDCDVRRMFPDGIYWVELKQTPNLALRQADLGARFGDDVNEYPDEQRGKQRLSDLLADKRALIILDDVWQKAHADAFLVRAPRCCFLLTTRLQALVDELDLRKDSEVKLNVLTDKEAIQLIEARLGTTAEAQHETFRQLHALLEGHTLALSLAAARLAKKGAAGAPEYLASLQRRLNSERPFFELDKLGEKQNKQLSVEVTLKESYEALSEDMQRRFRLLGIFAPDGTFDAKAAAAIWEEPAEDAPEYLQYLLDAALLTATADERYDQHALLRAHARARMTEAEHDALPARHFGWYANLHGNFEANNDEDRHALITPDFENVQAALIWGFKNRPSEACDLRAALDYYMQFYTPFEVRRRLLDQSLAAAEASQYIFGAANTLQALGDLSLRVDDLDGARAFYDRALPIYEQIGDRLGAANTLQALGDLSLRVDDLDGARAFYDRALPIYEQIGARL